MATRLRQSIAQLEDAFHEHVEAERIQSEELLRESVARTHTRRLEKQHKHGTLRFVMLVLLLTATAVLVTVAMFETLYIVMG
jgi:hypothetical protein